MPQPKDTDWLNGYQKQDPYMCCLIEMHFSSRTYKLRVRGWKKIFYANRNQKKAGVAILYFIWYDFKIKMVIKDKDRHYIMIKESNQEEEITIINTYIYAPNIKGK